MVAVSLFGGGFLVFVFVVAMVSLFVVGFFDFLSNLPLGIVVGAPSPNGALKWDARDHRQGPVAEDGFGEYPPEFVR